MPKVRASLLVGLLCLFHWDGHAGQTASPPRAVAGPTLDAIQVARPPLPTPRLPELEVIEWSPQTTEGSDGPTQIRIRFNRPVVAMGDPAMLAAKDALTIEPSLAGSTVWQTPELLVFTSNEPLPSSTEFQVRLRTPVQTYNGGRLDKPFAWTFQTTRLHIDEADHTNLPPREPVRLRFNQAVDPEALKHATRIVAAGRDLPFTVSRQRPRDIDSFATLADVYLERTEDGHDLWLVPQPTWPLDAVLDVQVAPTLRPVVGRLPLPQAWRARIHTAAAPTIVKVTCDEDDDRVAVTLNTELESDVRQSIIATPALAFEDADSDTFEAQGVPGTRYAIRLSPSARSAYDQSPKSTPTQTVTCAYPRPGLALSSQGGVFAPNQAPIVGVRSRGLKKVKILLSRLSGQESLPRPSVWIERVLTLQPHGPTQFAGTPVDLGPWFGPHMPVWVSVEPLGVGKNWPNRKTDDWREPRVGVFQKTNLAVTTLASEVHEIVSVVRMDTAQPVAGAQVKLFDRGRVIDLGRTDANGIQSGLATQRLFSVPGDRTLLMVTSPDGRDHALADVSTRFGRHEPSRVRIPREGVKLRPSERVTGALVLDRDVFQPGEKVRLVGWLAIASPYEPSGVRAVPAGSVVTVGLDRAGEPSLMQTWTVGAEGKIWGEVPLPENWLGRYELNASLLAHCSPNAEDDPELVDEFENETCNWRSHVGRATLMAKKFRNAEFFVEPQNAHSVPASDSIMLNVAARYQHGAPVPIRSARATVECRNDPAWSPEGVRTPHGYAHEDDDPDREIWHLGAPRRRTTKHTTVLALDPAQAARGSAAVTLPAEPVSRDLPSRCRVTLAVQDASAIEESAQVDVVVHPAAVYLALRTDTGRPGQPTHIRVRGFAANGQRATQDKIQVTLWDRSRSVEVGRWTVNSSASGDDAPVTTPPLRAGSYVVEASADGKVGRAREPIYVSRSERLVHDEPERLHVVAQRSGPRAHVDITGPSGDMHGLLVAKTAGLPQIVPFSLHAGHARVDLDVTPAWSPRVSLHALVYQPPGPQGPIRLLEGEAGLLVPPDDRRLNVTVRAPAVAKPGDDVTVEISAPELKGKPARVSVWAVDESVLALTKYTPPDLARELMPRSLLTWNLHTPLGDLLTAYKAESNDPLGPLARQHKPDVIAGLAGSRRPESEPAGERRFFETTPFYLGDAPLGPDGHTTVTFTLPHNLTSYRLTAIVSAPLPDGAAPVRFGLGRANITVHLPLQVRPILPRHLRPGDEAELSVLLDNLSDLSGRAEVRLANDDRLLTLLDPPVVTTDIAAHGQRRIGFRVRATSVGVAHLHFQTTLSTHVDRVQASIPVEAEPLHLDRVAVHGTTDANNALAVPVRLPTNAQRASIELALASSLLGSLDGAVTDLLGYPHACLEQTASRLVPLVVLGKQAQAHLPAGQTVKRLAAQLVGHMHDLRINRWSGFATWPGQQERSPFSAYATLVLVLAHKAGLDGSPTLKVNPTGDLFDFERRNECTDRLDDCAMTMLAAAEDTPAAKRNFAALNVLFERRWASLPPHVQALVLLAQARLDDSRLAKHAADLAARTVELGNTAHVNLDAEWNSSFFLSRASVDAVVLWALARTVPHHPIVAKLVRGLMEARPGAAWATTQENAFALLALTEYAKAMEATPPDFTVHSWVGLEQKPDVVFSKAAAVPQLTSSPVTAPVDVILQRTGRGRLYYSVALAYEDGAMDTLARGLLLQRRVRQPESLHAGDVVAWDIVLRNAVPLRQIAVDVPVPGGMDLIDIDLTASAALPLQGARCRWFTHEELHPQRALLFADSLPAGQHRHTLFLRALAPGRYALPAAHAQAMYAPDINGRTEAAQIRIEPAR